MFRQCTLALLALTLIGCATAPKMDPASVTELRANDVAVAFVYPDKKIDYNELVYKVLWNENVATTANFNGMWDIDGDLTTQFTQQFQQAGLNAVAIHSVLDENGYKRLSEELAAYQPNPQQGMVYSVHNDVRQALLDKGVEYLITLRGTKIFVQAQRGFNPNITLAYHVDVVDLRNNSSKYSGTNWAGARPDVDKSAREIEDNGLAKLRAGLMDGIKVSFERGVVPKNMGLISSAQ